jgi:tetratricopeptide (TPR) repeat protein
LGVAYDLLGRKREAVESYGRAIDLKPDYAEAHYNLGVAHLRAGERGAALARYAALKNISPEMAEGLFGLLKRDRVLDAAHR